MRSLGSGVWVVLKRFLSVSENKRPCQCLLSLERDDSIFVPVHLKRGTECASIIKIRRSIMERQWRQVHWWCWHLSVVAHCIRRLPVRR